MSRHKLIKLPTTQQELEEQIENLDPTYDGLRESALQTVGYAANAQASWDAGRQTGARKVGANTQRFLKRFSDFVGAYSGIIEILKGAGQVYGDVAYETLSIFLIVSPTAAC
jgi:hypothetical protein